MRAKRGPVAVLLLGLAAAWTAGTTGCAGARSPSARFVWGMRAIEAMSQATREDYAALEGMPRGPEREAAFQAVRERSDRRFDLVLRATAPDREDPGAWEAAMRDLEAEFGPRDTWPQSPAR